MKLCGVSWCQEHDDENTHMSAVTKLPAGWTFEITQMADEDEATLHLIDPRGLLHAALVPGLSLDDAIRFGSAVLNAGLAALPQKRPDRPISPEQTNCR